MLPCWGNCLGSGPDPVSCPVLVLFPGPGPGSGLGLGTYSLSLTLFFVLVLTPCPGLDLGKVLNISPGPGLGPVPSFGLYFLFFSGLCPGPGTRLGKNKVHELRGVQLY